MSKKSIAKKMAKSLEGIADAIIEGTQDGDPVGQMRFLRHRQEWPELWKHIDDLADAARELGRRLEE